MALLGAAALIASNQLPKKIGPKLHAAIDYSNAAVFFVAAALFWKRNKRAAAAALADCGAMVALAMLTDYSGELKKTICFETHGKIEAGLAGLLVSTPKLMGFEGESEARFFQAEAIAETLLYGLTDFKAGSSGPESDERAA